MLAIVPALTALLLLGALPASACEESCEQRCGRDAHAVLEECLAQGGDEATCNEAAADALHACFTERCSGGDDANGDDCRARCEARWLGAKHECLEAERPHDVCVMLADDVKRACLEEECTGPGPSCEETCQAAAEAGLRDCLENGGEEDECTAGAEAAQTECVAERCTDTPAADCVVRCVASAAENEAACVAEGEAPARCAARAAEAARLCIEDHCDGAPPQPQACESRCEDHAADDSRRCIADGGTEADCTAAADEGFAVCVAVHCSDDDSACDARCARKGTKVARRCARRGGDELTCADLAAEVEAACEVSHCVPPAPETCAAGCEAAGARSEALCTANEHPVEECTALGAGVREACLAVCGAAPEPTCEEQCEDQAVQMHGTILDAGASETRAARRARRVLRTCYRHCAAD